MEGSTNNHRYVCVSERPIVVRCLSGVCSFRCRTHKALALFGCIFIRTLIICLYVSEPGVQQGNV